MALISDTEIIQASLNARYSCNLQCVVLASHDIINEIVPRGQLATKTHSIQLGLHVDEILDNDPSVCIHLKSSWFICPGYLTYSHSSRDSTSKKLQHSLANPASYAGDTVGGELLSSESTFWWRIKRQSAPQTKLNSCWFHLRNSNEILVLGIHMCTTIWAHTVIDWPLENAMVNSPIKMTENSKLTFGNTLRTQNKDMGAAY